jgi:undecaprenyl-diphosphatase
VTPRLVTSAVAVALTTVLAVLVGLRWKPLLRPDQQIELSVHRYVLGHRWLFDVARLVTHLGDPVVVTVLTVALAAWLWWRGRRTPAGYVAAVRIAAVVVGGGLKLLVDRRRPALDHPLAHAAGQSFPSGHALGSAALWMAVAVLASRLRRSARIGLAVVVPVLVAATRVVLGVHFVTDVVAGLLLGWALALLGAHLLRVGSDASPSMAPSDQVNAR